LLYTSKYIPSYSVLTIIEVDALLAHKLNEMEGLMMKTTALRGELRPDKRISISFSKKALFGGKQSDEWHHQVDFTAGILRPSDSRFAYSLLQKHTDAYIKKKGRLSQQDVDIRLGILIETHDARDVAVAACAHAMSPAAVRALLNVELHVAPATFFGLEMYLESLIAANFSNPKSVTDLEAQWARRLLPYATHGPGAAGRYLEGLCDTLRTTSIPNMNVFPDFSMLARRAFKDFASQLEGFKLKSQWVTAQAAVAWMSFLTQNSPPVTPPGHLLPEHVLDTQFPIWRIWASWRPNLHRITILNGIGGTKRGVLPDMLALEGPDFIAGRHATLRDGLISQYGAVKPIVRFRSLVIEVVSCTKDELNEILNRVAIGMEKAVHGSEGVFKIFVQLMIARPITRESLRLLEAVSKVPDTPKSQVHNAVLDIWCAQMKISGRHILSLSHLISALDDPKAGELRQEMIKPWLIKGIEHCIKECQGAVRTHIEMGLKWTHLALELHSFCTIVKSSTHILSLLEPGIREQLDLLPPPDILNTVFEIYRADGGEKLLDKLLGGNELKDAIELFCIDRIMERQNVSHASQRTVDAILEVWNGTKSPERRHLAILASKTAGMDFVLRCRCFNQVLTLPDETVKEFIGIIGGAASSGEQSCIKFSRLLAKYEDVDVVSCWKGILYKMINKESATIIDYTLDLFKGSEWLQWMLDLKAIFIEVTSNPKASPPRILQLDIHLWIEQIAEFVPTISRLEEHLGECVSAVQCILKGGDNLCVENLLHILRALREAQDYPIEKIMQTITGKLSREGKNALEVSECVQALSATTPEGENALQRILDAIQDKTTPKVVIEVIMAGWLQEEEPHEDYALTKGDKDAIKALAVLYGLEAYESRIPNEKMLAATIFFKAEEDALIKEADRLEGIKEALMARDPISTRILLQQLGIPDTSALDDELKSLPANIIDAVEKIGDNEVEISFPLTAFKELERAALGIGNAKNLLVRLYNLDPTQGAPQAFCVHLDTDPYAQDVNADHTPWTCLNESTEPKVQYCYGKPTLLAFIMNRTLHRHIQPISEVSIAAIHDLIKTRLEKYVHECIICGTAHSSRSEKITLRRPMPCQSTSCTRVWNEISLDLRVPELRADPFSVDMILTGVYVAATSARMELLPGCPIKTTQQVTAILNTLPALSDLSKTIDISKTLKGYHKDAEQLLVWACTHYRGFITTANGICKIPSLPTGTHQFVLVNANPTIERDFVSRLPRTSPQSRVLWHGTSIDRLPSILAQGLRTLSGTNLQRTGAAHGKGIYMAEDPATSMSYSPSAVSWKNSGLSNMRLLLGCEVAGDGKRVSPGIHVIQDDKTVMVRYVFLLTGSAYSPNVNHVHGPMLSAMSALRTGAV
jgi:hypothetical protein